MRRLAPALALAVLALPAHAQVVQISSNIATNTTWGPTGTVVGSTFWIRNSIAINGGTTLTIQPGVVVKFDTGRSLTVNGTLTAVGTVVDSIFFTSIRDDNNRAGDTNGDGTATQPATGDWLYLRFPAGALSNSQLTYCDIRFAGQGGNGALSFDNSSQAITNCAIRRSSFGVDCIGTASPTLTNTSIEASQQTPIVIDFTSNPVFSSLVFSSANNGYDAIGLRGGTLTSSTTLPKRGATIGGNTIGNVTYVLLGSLTINPTGSLTISPGVVIKPVSGLSITVAGNLTMNGTASIGDTITITSIHDDNFGQPNDTNNNGSITAPNRGDWNRIVFQPGSTGSISRCRLRFGTSSPSQGVIEMSNLSIPVSNSTLSEAAHGLALFGVSNPALSNLAINNCSSTPILMSVSANPTFANVNFTANAVTALGLEGEDVAVDSHIFFRTVSGYTNITYYLMNGFLHMQSPAILTIDPGVVIKNQLGGGGMNIDGGLVANGTVSQPIVFTSERDDQYGNPADTNGDGSITTPAQANWTYIRFTGTTNDGISVMNYCRLAYGSDGPFDGWPASLWITSAAPTITHCTITKGAYGIRLDGDASATIDQCDINNCQLAPIVMSVLSDPNITTANSYSTNGYNALALLSETMSQNATLKYRPGVGSPTFAYLPTGTITVPVGVTLSIQPQVVLKPTSSFNLFNVSGALNCIGSNNTTGRVIFTSRRDDNPNFGGDTTPTDPSTPQAGDWGSIVFQDAATDAACRIRNVLFQFGSTDPNQGVLTMTSANPTLARLEFFQNGTAATFAGAASGLLDSTSILNCTQLPITMSLTSNPTFAHITLANSAYTALGILGETIAQDVRTPVRSVAGYSNLQYALAGNVTIAFGAKWTIDPGIVLKLGRIFSEPFGSRIQIDGALVAKGTPDSLIVLTSSADDAFGQDLRGDGALTSPGSGQWQGITFSAVSNDTATVIQNCRFRFGGYSGAQTLEFVNAGPTISNSVITASEGAAVSIEGNSTPTFVNCQFDSCTNVPARLSLVSEPVFTNVQFLGNAFTALGVINESIAQDVLWKIRPVAGRQNMPFLLQGQLTIGLGATLTMQPGVIVKNTGSASIFVQRAMIAEGRPDSLIVFTSYRDDFYGGDTNNDGGATVPVATDWSSILIDGTAIDPQVRFRDCIFRYGGGGSTNGVLRCVNSSPSVDSCLFAFNSVGITVEGASNPTVHGSSLYGNTNFAINNSGNSFCVNAEGNWWGAANGPGDASATTDLCGLGANPGSGDKVSNNVDYQPWATTGLQNPLMGDVSLNGQVLAYDASLVLQSVVSLITLSPLQQLVADVSGVGGITSFDATLILQYAAGVIRAFPAESNALQPASPDLAAARAWVASRHSSGARVSLGSPSRSGGGWDVPLVVETADPIQSIDLRLEGGDAEQLTTCAPRFAGPLHAEHASGTGAAVAIASLDPIGAGEIATLHFDVPGDFVPPHLAFANVNERDVAPVAPPAPAHDALEAPAPNPARDGTTLRLSIASASAGQRVNVRVLDVSGREIRTLADGPLAPGVHALTWDLRDNSGRGVPPGLYFVSARLASWQAVRRLSVTR